MANKRMRDLPGFIGIGQRNGIYGGTLKTEVGLRTCIGGVATTAACQMPERGRTHSCMNASCDVAHGAHCHHRDVGPVSLCAK